MKTKSNKLYAATVLLMTCISIYASAETILESADHNAVPEGGIITLSGSGLSGATGASMIWAGREFPTSATSTSDTEVQVIMPNVFQDNRDYHLLLKTPQGSAIGFASNVLEHTGTGTYTESISPNQALVVRAGAVLNGKVYAQTVVVETGGVLEVDPESLTSLIVAENGAVVDFSAVSESLNSTIFLYSPDTVVIGTIPLGIGEISIGQQLTPITPSYGLGTFTVGYSLHVQIDGPGSVGVTPEKEFYQYRELVSLSAHPATNAYFIRWIGPVTGQDLAETLTINEDITQIARFSTAPNYFTVWRSSSCTIEGGVLDSGSAEADRRARRRSRFSWDFRIRSTSLRRFSNVFVFFAMLVLTGFY